MKHLKKLSVVLLATTLFSASFTSCIENEVSPVVEAIYEAQADLIAAQAAVQDAEATLLLAEANAQDAQAAVLEAQAAQYTALAAQIDANTETVSIANANQLLVNEQNLLKLAAETALAVQNAQNELAVANANFNIEMAELAADLEALGAQIATEYAYAYRNAMNAANSILGEKLTAEADLAEAELMLTDYGMDTFSWAYVIAKLEANIATAEAEKAALEAEIADLEAVMADPTSMEAIRSQLDADEDAIDDMIDAKEIEIAEQYNKIMAIYAENDVADEFVDRYEEALGDLEDAQDEKEGLEEDIADATADIADWTADWTTYDADEAALETAVADAETALEAAEDAAVAAQEVEDDALVLKDEKEAALILIQDDIADLYANLQAAITLLATLEAGEAPLLADLAAAEAALAVEVAAEVVVQAEYDLRQTNFEASPAGVTWFAGPDMLMGNHADALTTYIYVATPVVGGPNTTGNVDMDPVDAGTSSPLTGAAVPLIQVTNTDGNDVAAAGDYYDLEVDDTSETNEDLYNDAVAALDAQKALTAAAQADVDAANDALLTYADDLLAAQEDYEYKKGLYEDGATVEAAAQAEFDAAETAYNDAVDASDAADDAEVDASDDLDEAEDDLADFQATTKEDLEDWIADAEADIIVWEAAIVAIQPIIDAKQAVVDAMVAEYDAYIASEGYLSSLQADLHAMIIAEWQVYWVLEQELAALEVEEELAINLINAYGGWGADNLEDIADYIMYLQEDVADAMDDIEAAKVALAEAQVEEAADTAYLAYLQALIDTLTARHANAVEIAEQYKVLMDTALAS